jgi:hypothetical protein
MHLCGLSAADGPPRRPTVVSRAIAGDGLVRCATSQIVGVAVAVAFVEFASSTAAQRLGLGRTSVQY